MAERIERLTPIGVEQMGDLADSLKDPQTLRLENLDTDVRPPAEAIETTIRQVQEDHANSYLPFLGMESLRRACVDLVYKTSGRNYKWDSECIISAGGLSGILNVLLTILEPGDEVLLTSPTYVGLINRVHLAGGVPRFVPLIPDMNGWRLDHRALAFLRPTRLKAVIMMSPSMPTGAVMTKEDWHAIIDLCREKDAWLINDTAMERLLFDQMPHINPARLTDYEKIITCGSASKEYRMIGWRTGWVVGPASIMTRIARVSIANVVCQTGIAMEGVAAAIRSTNDGIQEFANTLQQRRDVILEELREFNPIIPKGGWSLLIDMSPCKLSGSEASRKLLATGRVAATSMENWGTNDTSRYLRLVFANENTDRLRGLGERFRLSLRPSKP